MLSIEPSAILSPKEDGHRFRLYVEVAYKRIVVVQCMTAQGSAASQTAPLSNAIRIYFLLAPLFPSRIELIKRAVGHAFLPLRP